MAAAAVPLVFFMSSLVLLLPSSSLSSSTLNRGSSLSVETLNDDILLSPSRIFTAGFYPAGDNAFVFAIWFTAPSCVQNQNCTIVWMANRNQPVNGKKSTFSMLKNGNVVLTDAGQFIVWTTNTVADSSSVQLMLNDTGNLVLMKTSERRILWQSFDSPTDTLLPNQPFTRNTVLISSRSRSNFSSGFYKLIFDNDNVFRLLFDGPDVSSSYWPEPWVMSWQAGRPTYNSTRLASLDDLGYFSSSDTFQFFATDFGEKLFRRLVLDSDGNLRLYSTSRINESWYVTWQAISIPCFIHGVCGRNSLCGYVPTSGRQCSCIPGFKMVNPLDWSYGCEPEVSFSCENNSTAENSFVHLPFVDFYGNDFRVLSNYTYEQCESYCLDISCNCKGFQYVEEPRGEYNCYPKLQLINGHHFPSFKGDFYVKVKSNKTSTQLGFECLGTVTRELERTYLKTEESGPLKFMLWFACSLGGFELVCIFLVWFFFVRTHSDSNKNSQGYHVAASGFKRYTYAELKKATKNFSEEIGRGAGGTVFKAILSDGRVAAIKRLNEANQGEDEFLAEVGTVGKLNHMNLIEMWGYCAEGKHRLLVYEFMEHGSLAENLSSPSLDWNKRFEIALGTAKGLAYLHEECLEWVLHCDVKPQNILLDSNYQPKVSDFGLSKLLNRGDLDDLGFSRIRGTRGYMAPEWVFNSRITSKVDVYSYGIVVLEMVTGKSPTTIFQSVDGGDEKELRRLVSWVRGKLNGAVERESWLEEIKDPLMDGKFDTKRMQVLVEVALQCVEEDKDARPSMSQVVEILLHHEIDH